MWTGWFEPKRSNQPEMAALRARVASAPPCVKDHVTSEQYSPAHAGPNEQGKHHRLSLVNATLRPETHIQRKENSRDHTVDRQAYSRPHHVTPSLIGPYSTSHLPFKKKASSFLIWKPLITAEDKHLSDNSCEKLYRIAVGSKSAGNATLNWPHQKIDQWLAVYFYRRPHRVAAADFIGDLRKWTWITFNCCNWTKTSFFGLI